SMLAPPGYAKIVSTPSRSRHATRISLPDMVGPSSARLPGAAFLVSICVVLLIGALRFCFRTGSRRRKKPHDRCQPRVVVETQISLDKRSRWRRLRRRPAEPFVVHFLTWW